MLLYVAASVHLIYCVIYSFLQVQMFSYQCSQLSTSDSILDVFHQAKTIQSNKTDKSKFVSVVVLDEVGLAEDSPSLPLKVLHPLLEDGTEGNSYSVDVCILLLMYHIMHAYFLNIIDCNGSIVCRLLTVKTELHLLGSLIGLWIQLR